MISQNKRYKRNNYEMKCLFSKKITKGGEADLSASSKDIQHSEIILVILGASVTL